MKKCLVVSLENFSYKESQTQPYNQYIYKVEKSLQEINVLNKKEISPVNKNVNIQKANYEK